MLFQSVFTRRLSRVFEWLISLALLMSATVAGSGAECRYAASTRPLRGGYELRARVYRTERCRRRQMYGRRRQPTDGHMNVPSLLTSLLFN